MKKLVLIFTVALMLCSSVAMAQRVDVASINAKLEKSDADAEHAKKGLKASTWMSRGDLYYSTLTEPTKALFVGIDGSMLDAACGAKGKPGQKKIGSKQYKTMTYGYFIAYLQNNKVVAWTTSKLIKKEALDIALKSYAKAVELDPNMKDKAKASLDKISDYYKQLGSFAIMLNDINQGVNAYTNVCKVQESPLFGGVDPMMQFSAGYMLTLQGEKVAWSYPRGENILKKALANGYSKLEDANKSVVEADRGNIYYYLYYCAYAQREKTPAKVNDAKKYLQEGINKYPKNTRIFDSLLHLYTNEAGMGDPTELLETIEKTIKINPKSANAWYARGRIYYALEDYDECIASFKHVVEIEPKAYDGNYYLGLFYMLKADAMLSTMKGVTYTDQAKYDADMAELNKIYAQAVPYFEVAHTARPKDSTTLEYLKQLCFRLREEPGMMDKYTKYNDLFKAL